MSNSYCSSEPFSCAAIEQDCTLGLVIQIFNGSYDAGVAYKSAHIIKIIPTTVLYSREDS